MIKKNEINIYAVSGSILENIIFQIVDGKIKLQVTL